MRLENLNGLNGPDVQLAEQKDPMREVMLLNTAVIAENEYTQYAWHIDKE